MSSNTLLLTGRGQYVGLVFQLVFATTFVVSDLFGTTDCARRDALADSNNKTLVVRSREIETKSISTAKGAGLTKKSEHYRWSSAYFRSLGILPGTNSPLKKHPGRKTPRQDA